MIHTREFFNLPVNWKPVTCCTSLLQSIITFFQSRNTLLYIYTQNNVLLAITRTWFRERSKKYVLGALQVLFWQFLGQSSNVISERWTCREGHVEVLVSGLTCFILSLNLMTRYSHIIFLSHLAITSLSPSFSLSISLFYIAIFSEFLRCNFSYHLRSVSYLFTVSSLIVPHLVSCFFFILHRMSLYSIFVALSLYINCSGLFV